MPTKAELEAELQRMKAARETAVDKLEEARDPEKDARNRAFRTWIQVVAIEVLVVVLPLTLDVLDGSLSWSELGRSAARSLLGALLAYVMRKHKPPEHQS